MSDKEEAVNRERHARGRWYGRRLLTVHKKSTLVSDYHSSAQGMLPRAERRKKLEANDYGTPQLQDAKPT